MDGPPPRGDHQYMDEFAQLVALMPLRHCVGKTTQSQAIHTP